MHRKAMEFADEAYIGRLEKDRKKYLHFTRLALEKEAAAADLMVDEDVEPTRSVLHRSAATLAWRCQEYDRAKRLAYRALAGNPPSDIEWELNDLLGTVKLEEAGIRLGKEQLQFSLQGGEIGHGKAALSELSSRMPSIRRMLQITANSVYRRLSNTGDDIVERFSEIPVFIDGTAPGSFIVSLRLGMPVQSELPGFERFENVVQPFLDNLNLLERSEFYELEKELGDPADYLGFVNAARKLAPDGKKVDLVKFQASLDDQLRVVSFSRPQRFLANFPLPKGAEDQEAINGYQATDFDIRKTGVLKLADGLVKTKCVLVTDENAEWDIEGPEETLDAIVRAYFKRRVEVKGKRMRKRNLVDRIWLDNKESVKIIDDTSDLISSTFSAKSLFLE